MQARLFLLVAAALALASPSHSVDVNTQFKYDDYCVSKTALVNQGYVCIKADNNIGKWDEAFPFNSVFSGNGHDFAVINDGSNIATIKTDKVKAVIHWNKDLSKPWGFDTVVDVLWLNRFSGRRFDPAFPGDPVTL